MRLLNIQNLWKSFGGNRVLSGVDLPLDSGTILALAGENGAGKSTLVKCITGQYRPDSGTVECGGTVSCVPQEFNLVNDLSVAENIFLGREPSVFGFLKRREMAEKSKRYLEMLHADIDPEETVSGLRVAQKQMVETAKAISVNCRILILDEPTTVLNRGETAALFQVMRDFKNAGGSILFITHRLDEIMEICDECAVLRDGALIARNHVSELTPKRIAESMVGRELRHFYPPRYTSERAEIALSVRNLRSGTRIPYASFDLKAGSVTGLAGLAGSGRTELAEAVCGFRETDGGEIRVFGEKIVPRQSSGYGIVYLTEDRQGAGILTDFSVTENITLASLVKYCRFGIVNRPSEKKTALDYIRRFRIKAESPDTLLGILSGGNQQKAAIAKCLDADPKIFIFDEPTRGVDIGAKSEIYQFIRELAEKGMACLLISSDLEEIIGTCPRVLVMRNGTIAGELSGDNVNEKEIMYLATGVQ